MGEQINYSIEYTNTHMHAHAHTKGYYTNVAANDIDMDRSQKESSKKIEVTEKHACYNF